MVASVLPADVPSPSIHEGDPVSELNTDRDCLLSSGSSTDDVTRTAPSTVRIVDGLPLRTFWSILSRDLGYDLQPLPHNEWLARVEDMIAAKGPSHVFFPFLHTLKQENVNEGGERSDRTCEVAISAAAEADGEGTTISEASYGRVEAAIRRNVQYLIEVRFLPAPDPAGSRE